MSINPLWRFVENFNEGPTTFRQTAMARGSSGNTHSIWVTYSPNAVVESTNLPVYTNEYDHMGPALRAAVENHFGGGNPSAGGGVPMQEWLRNNVQYRFTNISSNFQNRNVPTSWTDLSYELHSMSYSGGGLSNYTIQFRNKYTGQILAAPVFSLNSP